MKKLFSLITLFLMAIGVSAQETVLIQNGGSYGNGATFSTANAKMVLGNDRTSKNYDVKLSGCKAYCAELFGQTVPVLNEETGENEDKTRVVYVVGNQNPKDGELNGDSSSGSNYNPESRNLPKSGCYYMFTPSKDGHFQAFIILNASKNFYVCKGSTGENLPISDLTLKADGNEPTVVTLNDDYTVSEKLTGTLEFDVVANETYYIFCTASKLSFGGYVFTPNEVAEIPLPQFSPESGQTVAYGSEVTISYDDAFTLYYTTDGSDPKDPTANVITASANPEAITVDQEGTFTVKAYLSGDAGESDVVTATYTVDGGPVVVGTPTFDPAPGAVEKGTQVHIVFGENAQSVYFTTDGSDPKLASPYPSSKLVDAMSPIFINEETTIKAFCRAEIGGKTIDSELVEVTYTIKEPEVLPESNVTFDPVDAMPAIFDGWDDSFLITKTGVKAGDKFTFICEPYEVEGWQWGPQVLPKSNLDWTDLAPALIPDEEGKAVFELTEEMAGVINSYGGLRIQGMAVKVLAVQFEAGPEVGPGPEPQGDIVDLIDQFTGNWNGAESNTHNADKSITYNGVSWGGLSAWFGQVDWSEYEKLVFEFAEPTTVNVQGFVQTTSEDIKYWGNPGITKLECPFEGKDVSAVKQAALQLSDPATIVITKIYLVKKSAVEPAPEFALTFDPESGTEVEVGNEITLTFDDETFLLYYTTDGTDPKDPTANVTSAWGTNEVVTVAGQGDFVIKAYLEDRKTNAQSEVFTATYPIKAVAEFVLTFDPESGTEVEVGNEITLIYDDEAFLLYYTTDGTDPKDPTANVTSAWGTNEVVTVAGQGDFVIKAYLEDRKTNAQSEVFTATYPIKAVAEFAITFDPVSGTEVAEDDIITMSFDGDVFNCSYTTDGSDPRTSMTMMTAMPEEFIIVKGSGEFVITAVLENLKTGEMSEPFQAIYPIKADITDVVIATKANGYGTFCFDKDLNFAASDAKAYIARVSGTRVFLTEVEEVPAGTGVLVEYKLGEEVAVPVMEGAAPITQPNDFVGVLEDTEVAYGSVSILSVVNGKEGFYKFLGTTIPANKAYFPTVADNTGAMLSLVFDETDGINSIIADAIDNGDAYNLNGQRVQKSYKGIVVVKGKKYIKK